jgi:hypothetical protein
MAGNYAIVDEPSPSALTRVAVSPLWIFLGAIFGGAGIGLLWFALNSVAIGSASKKHEFAYVALGLLGTPVIYLLLGMLWERGVIGAGLEPYLHLVTTIFQLLVVYQVHLIQSRSFQLFELFGGVVRNGVLVVVALALLRPRLAEMLGAWSLLLL